MRLSLMMLTLVLMTTAFAAWGCGGSGGGAAAGPPAPTVTGVVPALGSNFGGTALTVTGTGFTGGAVTVTCGGTPMSSVVVVDDTTITCTSPAGPAGPGPIVVANSSGSGSAPYALFEPILVADAGGNPVPVTWDLWALDPATATAHLVGPIGFGVTAMDFHPLTGVLYGTTAPGAAGGPRQLITINPATGAGTLVGPTDDAGAVNHTIPGMAFVGNTLYGTDGPGTSLVSINTSSGLVTVVGPNPPASPGGAFASDVTSTNTYYMTSDMAPIHSVNVATSVFTAGPLLNGFALPGGRMSGATYHQGTLYGLDADGSVGGQPSPRQVVVINPASGLMTPIGPILPSPFTNAMASRTR